VNSSGGTIVIIGSRPLVLHAGRTWILTFGRCSGLAGGFRRGKSATPLDSIESNGAVASRPVPPGRPLPPAYRDGVARSADAQRLRLAEHQQRPVARISGYFQLVAEADLLLATWR